MITDARTVPDDVLLEADICIVGAGPAGITAALELAKASGLRILLLESGGETYEDESQALNAGPALGMPYPPLDDSRLRMLGGSSNHWAGNCMRLQPSDFEKRDWTSGSAWPIGLADISPYYDRATPYVEIQQERNDDFDHWAEKLGGRGIDWTPDLLKNIVSCGSPPTAFGEAHRAALEAAGNLTILLHANVLEIDTTDTAREVTGLQVACIDGPRFRVRARAYVLAQGGIEVARLLLLSDRVAATGLGNGHDQVGRYFADHFSLRPALWFWPRLSPEQSKLFEGYTELETGAFQAVIASSDALLRREAIGGFMFHLEPTGIGPGRVTAENLLHALRQGEAPRDLGAQVIDILLDLDDAADAVYAKLAGGRGLLDRHWIGPWLNFELKPSADNRVRLVEDRDRFGQRRIGLDWRPSADDRHTVRRAVEILVSEIGRLGLGRSWTDVLRDGFDWPELKSPKGHPYLGAGKHACCTTRMSAEPGSGVVDADCRVHGISNLFIASSSVFSTSSYVQPTYSIVAFSIRLADHLAEQFSKGAL